MKIDLGLDAKMLGRLQRSIEDAARELVVEMAQFQILSIRKRLNRGVGVLDQKMPAYGAMTQAARRRRGRQTRVRDLQHTGSMVRSMHVARIQRQSGMWVAVIGFTGQVEAIKAIRNQERSPWFGISPKDSERLQTFAAKRLRAIAARKGL